MKLGRYTTIFLIFLCVSHSFAQNRGKAQLTINDLASEKYAGRGYIDSGDFKAANYIRNSYDELGLQPVDGSFYQHFDLSVNTIQKVELKVNGITLKPGYDYLVSPGSPSLTINKNLFFVSMKMLESKKAVRKVKKAFRKGYLPVFPKVKREQQKAFVNLQKIRDCIKPDVWVFLEDHLTWSVSQKQEKVSEVVIRSDLFTGFEKDFNLQIESQFIPSYTSQNVMGMVKGTEHPDSFILLCGHYDHLGKMGEATFYGANDNASGIAMLLDMAEYFAKNPQKYSLLFVAFGGEEAGLVGSRYFVEHNPSSVQLSQIKFVFNMDLMGSGEDGATIVNGSVFKDAFEHLKSINTEKEYLPKIKSRGKAANSDHYFFTESGIPSFFIYLIGDYKHYHIPQDNAQNLVLSEYYDRSFQLIRDFIIRLNL